jgi:phospholipid transport system substrate-binding protein
MHLPYRFLILILALFSQVSLALEDPQAIVRSTADKLMAEVNQKRAALLADPKLVAALSERYTSPYFDYAAMTQSAVGRFWRNANDLQKVRLIEQFKQLLVKTYGMALLNMSDNLSIEYPPYSFNADDKYIVVPTKMQLKGSPAVPVNYRVENRGGAWKVIDITIDGVSLVTNYRSSFAREIQLGAATVKGATAERMSAGFERLIKTLADKNNS